MKKKQFAVLLGRFQPVHNGHLGLISKCIEKFDKLIIVIGSDCSAKTVKNPWTTGDRVSFIESCLTKEQLEKVEFLSAKDYLYNDNLWITSIQSQVSSIEGFDEAEVFLCGHDKDKSTFYLKFFPKWEFIELGRQENIDATKVREFYFHKDKISLKNFVPEPIYKKLVKEMDTEGYNRLYDEFRHIVKYKSAWSAAPYEPIFVTTDAVVIKSGHVLVVKRKGELGKGLIALPGGFLNHDEKIIDSCLRELKEETCISLPKDELKKRIIDQHTFDAVGRSLRGRTITHAFCFDLVAGELPKVKGSDDADKAWWMSLRDVLRNEEMFFEDHFHIIQYFCSRF